MAWLRALELTAPIWHDRDRILFSVIEERAAQLGDTPALLSDRECLTYRELSQRIHQYARWALHQGIDTGEVFGLLMGNRPEYLAIWLGVTSVPNTNLSCSFLGHCVDVVSLKHLIVSAGLFGQLGALLPRLSSVPTIWIHGQPRHLSAH